MLSSAAMAFGNTFSLEKAIAVLLAWDSIGNSSWYIFAILFCYLGTWAAFALAGKLFQTSEKADYHNDTLPVGSGALPVSSDAAGAGICFTFVFLAVYCVVLAHLKTDSPRYYNTVFCYIAGMGYANYKEKIDEFLQKSNLRYYGILLGEALVFGSLCVLFLKWESMPLYLILSALFSVLIVQITMKLKIGNMPLMLLGDYVFEVYILQRLPMIALKHVDAVYAHFYLYLLLCIVITAFLSIGFKKIEDRWL